MWIMWKLWMKGNESGKYKGKRLRSSTFFFVSVVHIFPKRYPQTFLRADLKNVVDNVDNLLAKQGFADFMDISGAHSYQQITVYTIFQKKIFYLIKSRKINTVFAEVHNGLL